MAWLMDQRLDKNRLIDQRLNRKGSLPLLATT
jgi:hypothetical protein